MKPVSSSAIAAVGYDGKLRDLLVRFVSGELYAYHGVGDRLYREFLAAPSKGRFFAERIRDRYGFDHLA